MQFSKAQEREAVAFHEAGHAVVSLLLGLPVHDVSVRPTAEWNGAVDSGWVDLGYMAQRDETFYPRWATMLMAGPIAKRAFWLGSLDLRPGMTAVRVWGGAHDLSSLKGLALKLGLQPEVVRFQRLAAALLRDNWVHVEEFAAALIALDQDDFLSVWYSGVAARSECDAKIREMMPHAKDITTYWHKLTPQYSVGQGSEGAVLSVLTVQSTHPWGV